MRLRYLVLAGAAFLGAGYASARIKGQRRRVRVGAIEDPEVARAYQWVTRMPQFRLGSILFARRAVDGLQEGRALDLGSGTGQLAIEIAEMAPKLAVIGLDMSDAMLDLASANARQADVGDRVTFIKGVADRVPYPDASFDLVVSTLSMHHWPDPVAVFNEIQRVLRPGGRFMIFDLRRDVGLAPWLLFWFATHVVVPGTLRRMNEPMSSREAAYTSPEVVEMLSRSLLQNWQGTTGPFWLTVESISGPSGSR